MNTPNLEALRHAAQSKSSYGLWLNIHTILSAILKQSVWVQRVDRGRGDRRICISDGTEILLPTLDGLSAGQSSLFSMFGTLLRYSDFNRKFSPIEEIEGICIIDEIDAHLHADLQHDVLPKLLKAFPRIQFIVTSHSPLFPLGMTKTFGDDGFTLINMPSGTTITAERFSEFESSLAYFKATQTFEQHIKYTIERGFKPLVLCEGETDPKYLSAACHALGLTSILTTVEFEWIGRKDSDGGAEGGGEKNLDSALRFLRNNPQFITRSVVFLYDSDTKRVVMDDGRLHIRILPLTADHPKANKGIENLLPVNAFDERFYSHSVRLQGCDKVTLNTLNKVQLCEAVCQAPFNPVFFANFRVPLEELAKLFDCDT